MSEPFIGEIKAFGFSWAPRGWSTCQGQIISISENQALFSLIGTIYGGDGRSSMGLPDLRGRVAIGQGSGPGLHSYSVGMMGGYEYVTLNTNEMPSHSHSLDGVQADLKCSSAAADQTTPSEHSFANNVRGEEMKRFNDQALDSSMKSGSIDISGGTVSPTGGNQPHVNVQPYLTINYCIALLGIYPSRN